MNKTIHMTLDTASIDAAIRELKDYRKRLEHKAEELRERVAELIVNQAQPVFDAAIADDTFKIVVKGGEDEPESPKIGGVTVTKEQGGENTTLVIASGEDAIFMEFGAGVHYNGAVGSYPNPLGATLDAIAAIGTYGEGYGRKDTWGFLGEDGNIHLTHGAPASMPLYKAIQSVSKDIARIAREVFDS